MSMKPYKWFPGTSGWVHEVLNKLPENVRTKVRPCPLPPPPPQPTTPPSPPLQNPKQLRSWALFRPDDINDLYPFPRNRISYPGVDRIKGYRYPAPGSRPAVNIPQSESTDR